MERTFDYIDFVQNHRLQQNLREYEEKDAPEDVLVRVRDFARTAADPNLGKDLANSAFDESPYESLSDYDFLWDATDTINSALVRKGWIPDEEDSAGGVFYYERNGKRIKVQIEEY